MGYTRRERGDGRDSEGNRGDLGPSVIRSRRLAHAANPALEPNQIRVTYDHDEARVWNDWSFRIRRQI